MKSGDDANGLRGTDRSLVVFGKAAEVVEPGKGTLNDPTLGQDFPLGLDAH